jgi:outer membrane protein
MRSSDRHQVLAGTALAVMVAMAAWPTRASAETIDSAMARAYQTNPQLNSQRAQLRAVDENVPQAMSGYRPKVNVTATAGQQYTDQTIKAGAGANTMYGKQFANVSPYSVGATLTQPVFDGFQTPNRVGAAETNVSAQREALRVLEQTVLLTAATAYMDVTRDGAALEVNHLNVRTLEELLSQTRERFNAGEVTQTDVSQAEAQLAQGRTTEATAQAQYNTSRATFRQVIGIEAGNLAPASPVDRFSPSALVAAIERAELENPNVTSAMYGVDVAYLQIKINEGALFPQLSVQANAQFANSPAIGITNQKTASAIATLTIPIYNGGTEYSLIRQSKETLEQQRLNVDFVREQVRQSVVQFWGQAQATKTQVQSTEIQVKSAQTALNGIRQEAKVGQRTTFDVLTAQQNLVNARLAMLVAQHDRVVASYGLLGSTGRLAPQVLGLPTAVYDPSVHYKNTRDAWFGVRPHDGDKNFQVGTRDTGDFPAIRQAKATADTAGEPMQQAAAEDAKAEGGKGEERNGDVKKADGRKMQQPMSLARAASGAPLEPAPEPAGRASAPRQVAARSQPGTASRMPNTELQPEDVLLPRDIQPEPARMAAPSRDMMAAPSRDMQPETARTAAPSPKAQSSTGMTMQGAVPVVSSDRFGGGRPAPRVAPQAANAAPRAPTPAVPVTRPISGGLPALPSDRFDTHAPPAQPRFVTGDSTSFAEPTPILGSGAFTRIK